MTMQKRPVVKNKAKRPAESSGRSLQIFIVIGVAVVASIVHQNYSTISNYLQNKFKKPVMWQDDPIFRQSMDSVCDFQLLNISDLFKSMSRFEDDGLPIIVRGAAFNWSAIKNWEKENLLSLYGNRSILTGSESSIVYSGGTAAAPVHLKSIIDKLNNHTVDDTDSFVFDASILQSIPELMKDVEVFKVFQHWDSPANEKKKTMWHMLSLGPSRSGLPFHSHGRTWLAVIHGAKQWYVYPPGYSAPPSVELSLNPLLPVIEWFRSVLPRLRQLPKPPLKGANAGGQKMTTEERERGFQPLQCIQNSGDLVFLPARWSHLTLNIGETIAIGGQASLGAAKRHASAVETLKKNPLHFESLKDAGLGQAHMAMERTRHIQQSIDQLLQYNNAHRKQQQQQQQQSEQEEVDESLILQLQSQSQLKAMLTATHDSWLVLYVEPAQASPAAAGEADGVEVINTNASATPEGLSYDEILAAATELTDKLDGRVNVAIFDTTNAPTNAGKDKKPDESEKKTFSLRLHGGDALHTDLPIGADISDGDEQQQQQMTIAQAIKNFQVDETGTLYTGDVRQVEEVVKFVDETMTAHKWQRGSVNGVTVMVQNMMIDAQKHIQKAVELKPLHPETRGMLGELYGLSNDIEAMKASISESVALFDGVNREGISTQSIASVYHKLGTSYLSKELSDEAIPLLKRSLDIQPTYVPALVDLIVCHFMNHDRPQAAETLKQLMKIAPQHPGIPKFKQAISGM